VRTLFAIARLSRLKFLAGGFLAVGLGTLVARYEHHPFSVAAYLLAQCTVTVFQLMTHYSNDFFDQECDERSVRTAFSGGSGVLQRKELPATFAARLALATASLGLLAAILIAMRFSLAATALALLIGILSWSYSAPPPRLLARGLGEMTTALVVAILVPLFAYAMQTHTVDGRAIVSTLPAGCAMFAMMLCVEIPDRVADAASGKENLLVRFGLRKTHRMIELCLIGIFVAAACAVLAGAPRTFAYFALGVVPVAISLMRALGNPSTRDAAIAARGVLLFAATVGFGVLGYAAAAV
jgi:1,4-dihydroxy-2-naphthoate octaprenyltransferase